MSGLLPVRVTVLDTWDEVAMALPSETSVGELKSRALAASRVHHPESGYLVKFLGAELLDESASLEAAGVFANAALIVLGRRRVPAR